MATFLTTQWVPQLDKHGNLTSFTAEGRGVTVRPGEAARLSDRTYHVQGDGSIRRAGKESEKGKSKKERVKARRPEGWTRNGKLGKRERAICQSMDAEAESLSNLDSTDAS